MAINYKRTVNTRPTEKFIVIAVEGKITEPEYFGKIRDELKNINTKLKILPPLDGASAPKKRLAELLSKLKNYSKTDSFWLVCDVDRHNNLHEVIKEAKKNKIQPIISNPCFEVWLYLYYGNIKIIDDTVHFDATQINQDDLSSGKMKEEIYESGKKSKYNDHQIAIQRAQNLITETNTDEKNFLTEKKHRGKTNVYKLVQEILGKNSQNQNK